MTDGRASSPDDEIERQLRDLGQSLDWPASVDLRPAIAERLALAPSSRWSPLTRLASVPTNRLAWAASLTLALILGALLVAGPARSSVADRIGLPGLSISTDPTAIAPVGVAFQLGDPATLDDARIQTGGRLVAPPVALLGPPDEVYLLQQRGTVQVSYVYLAGDDLDGVLDTGVGLLISQFAGRTNESFIGKQIGAGTSLASVGVNGAPGYWLEGAPHVFVYEDEHGQFHEESIRLAGNVLIWEEQGLTLRIESALDRETVIRIAESMSLPAGT